VEATRQARRVADIQASKVWETIVAHKREVILEACRVARAGAGKFAEDVSEVMSAGERAVQKRSQAYAGLRFVARIAGPELSFDPSFPVDGSVVVPVAHERRVLGVVELLERLWITDDVESVG